MLLALGRRRNLDTRGALLLLLLLLARLLLLHHLQLLLEAVEAGSHGLLLNVDGRNSLGGQGIDIVLAGSGIVVDLLALSGGGLCGEMLLLLVESSGLLLSELVAADVELLELLGCSLDAPELLLQSLLLLGKIHVGGDKLGIEVGIHLLLQLLVHGQLGRSEHLVNRVLLSHLIGILVLLLLLLLVVLRLLVELLVLLAVLRESGQRRIINIALAIAVAAVPSELLHGAVGTSGRHGTKRSRRSRLGGRSQARKQMRAAGTGSWNAAVLVFVALLNGIKGERLDVLAATARGQATGRSKVGRHLSETTCVHGSEKEMKMVLANEVMWRRIRRCGRAELTDSNV